MFVPLLAIILGVVAPTDTPRPIYQIHAIISKDGQVKYEPRMLSKSGEQASFVIDTPTTHFAFKATAQPKALSQDGPDGIGLSIDVEVGRGGTVRRIATEFCLKSGEHVIISLPASKLEPPETLNLTVDQI